MKEFIINENEAGQRFDKYLAKLLKEILHLTEKKQTEMRNCFLVIM